MPNTVLTPEGSGAHGLGSLNEAGQRVLADPTEYWRKQLPGNVPVLQLPTDRARTAVETYCRAVEPLGLGVGFAQALRALSQSENVTVFETLLGAFQTFLSRYTGQDDIMVASPVAGRHEAENGTGAGRVANTLVMRTDVNGDPTFRELLGRVRAVVAGAYAHQDARYEQLTSPVGREKDPSRGTLAQVMLSVVPHTPPLGPAANVMPDGDPADAKSFDLQLEFSDEAKDSIGGRFIYNAALFDARTIARMGTHFRTMLQAIVTDPDKRLSELPLLEEPERQQILVEWNRTQADYPRDRAVHELVEAQAQRNPDSIAVEHEGRELTYRELNARANQLAHHLMRRGVGPEVPVGICLERSPQLAVALLGVLKAGGACMPLDPQYPEERLAYMREDARAPVLVTQPSLLQRLTEAHAEVVCLTPGWEVIAQESQENPASGVKPDNLAYLIYTSGSTGKPRGVLLTHGGLVNHHVAVARLYGLHPGDRVLQFSSISFDIAVEEIFPAWTTGAAVVFRPEEISLQIADFQRWIREQRITVLDLPTAYWHEWMHELGDLKEPLPESLRLTIVGGEKASATAYSAWLKLGGDRIRWINTYGPTEASVIATAYEPNPRNPVPFELPIGRPIANTQVYILDSRDLPVPIGVVGELHIGGPGVARGYLNRPELTADKFIQNPFSKELGARLYKTGDLARFTPDGTIEFRGRRDDQMKIRGFRVELGEIEVVLGKHPDVRDVAVVAREHAPGDKRLIAYLVPDDEPAPNASDLRSFLKSRLPDYMMPSAFVMLEAMPLTPNGKVDRRALPVPDRLDLVSPEEFTAPRDKLESQLLSVWEEVLGVRPIGIRHNFFELGGNSLLAVRLMHRMDQAFGRKLPIATLLHAPTVEQLAGVIRQDGWQLSWSSLVAIQPNGSAPPFFCVHGLGGTVLRFHALAHYLGPDQPFYGLQASGLDGKHAFQTRVEDMAAHYIREIRSVQPKGPYYIGGYSFGGLVAYEMAQQLRAQGQEVGLVALFDTFAGRPKSNTSLLFKFLRFSPHQMISYAYKKLRGHIQFWINSMWFPSGMVDAWKACFEAEKNYVAKVYPSRVTLFLPSERSLRSLEDREGGWGKWAAGGVEVFEIAGDHGSITREPQVRLLADALRGCLGRARQ